MLNRMIGLVATAWFLSVGHVMAGPEPPCMCQLYADLQPDGGDCDVDLDDIFCVLDGFAEVADCPQADIAPCAGNIIIDIDDIFAVLDAFAADYACPHPCPPGCGGLMGLTCAEGEYCELPVGRCCCDVQGECAPIPDDCPPGGEPVCACNGVTYDNECEASAAGTSIDHAGPCAGGATCGGIGGVPCGEGEFCNLGVGHCCCDFQGVCERLPILCLPDNDPVCGCNGTTYANPCEANAAGTSINHVGPC